MHLRSTSHHTPPRAAAIGACLAAVALAACRADAPAPGGTVQLGGTAAPVPAAAATGAAAGTVAPVPGMSTAVPVQATTPPAGTPAPTAEAATTATARFAAAMALVLPRYTASFGVAGTEPGQITLPFDVAVAGDGGLFVSDSTGVQKFAADGSFARRIGEGVLKRAEGIAVGPDDRLYVAGSGAEVLVFDAAGNPAGAVGAAGDRPGQLRKPIDVAVDRDGNLYVADAGNARVEKFAPGGRHLLSIGERGTQSGQFTAPRSVAVDGSGRIYVGLGDDFLIQRFDRDGSYLDTFGQGTLDETMFRIGGIAVDDRNRAYATQAMGHALQVFDVATTPVYVGQIGGKPGITAEQFNAPTGVALGPGRLFVADTRNNRVQVFEIKP